MKKSKDTVDEHFKSVIINKILSSEITDSPISSEIQLTSGKLGFKDGITRDSITPTDIDLSKYLGAEITELEGPSFCFGNSERKFKHIYVDGFDISPFIDIIKDIKTELADRGDFHVNVPKLVDVLFKLGVVFANDTED